MALDSTRTRRLAVSLLTLVVTALLAGIRYLERAPPAPPPPVEGSATAVTATPTTSAPSPATSRVRISLGDARLEAQVAAVIESFDATGRPPSGVAQGGRRGGPKGVFDNAQGRLPRQAPRYYTETDVWPHAGNRGAARLVFGKGGEVYYSGDHYKSFVQVR